MTDKTEAETIALIEHYGEKFARLGNLRCVTAFGPEWVDKRELITDVNRLRKLVLALPEKTK